MGFSATTLKKTENLPKNHMKKGNRNPKKSGPKVKHNKGQKKSFSKKKKKSNPPTKKKTPGRVEQGTPEKKNNFGDIVPQEENTARTIVFPKKKRGVVFFRVCQKKGKRTICNTTGLETNPICEPTGGEGGCGGGRGKGQPPPREGKKVGFDVG